MSETEWKRWPVLANDNLSLFGFINSPLARVIWTDTLVKMCGNALYCLHGSKLERVHEGSPKEMSKPKFLSSQKKIGPPWDYWPVPLYIENPQEMAFLWIRPLPGRCCRLRLLELIGDIVNWTWDFLLCISFTCPTAELWLMIIVARINQAYSGRFVFKRWMLSFSFCNNSPQNCQKRRPFDVDLRSSSSSLLLLLTSCILFKSCILKLPLP